MSTVCDDNYIIELYWTRDERAIAVTQDKYGGYCYKIAMNILNDSLDAEETVNDTYYKVWSSIPPSRPQCFVAYIGRITRNLSINRINARHTQKRVVCEYAVSFEEIDNCILSASVEIGSDNSSELSQYINTFLSKQKKPNRIMFVCRYFYSDGISEIAQKMNVTENKVRTVLHRMRGKLKKFLEARYE